MTGKLSETSYLNVNSCFFSDFRIEYHQVVKMVISRFFVENMSKNNTIRKSDKKFIRTEKARIRRQFSDLKKQKELISQLYVRFLPNPNLNNESSAHTDKSIKPQLPITKSQTNPKTKIEKKEAKSVKKETKEKK